MDKSFWKYMIHVALDALGFILIIVVFVCMVASLIGRCFESNEEERKEEVIYYDEREWR